MTTPPEWKITLSDLDYGGQEEAAVLEVLRSGWLTMGPRTERFEGRVAELSGARFGVAVSSCTSGLHLLLAAADVGPGDEVLLPALTFVATANVVIHCGATPIFCDIVSAGTPLIDPAEIARKLTPRTRAVLTVDYAGFPCDYDAIAGALGEYSGADRPVALLEDAAHGIGGRIDAARALGMGGRAGVFSFFSNKNVPTGEGGMIVTDDERLADRVRILRQHGISRSTWERHQGRPGQYDVLEPGWNFRPTELLAALGAAHLERLGANQAKRRAIVEDYHRRFAELPEVELPFAPLSRWHQPACHVFPILLPGAAARDRVRDALHAARIQTSHHYTPITQFTYYRERVPSAAAPLPRTDDYAARELTLPLHPLMGEDDAALIVQTICDALAS